MRFRIRFEACAACYVSGERRDQSRIGRNRLASGDGGIDARAWIQYTAYTLGHAHDIINIVEVVVLNIS